MLSVESLSTPISFIDAQVCILPYIELTLSLPDCNGYDEGKVEDWSQEKLNRCEKPWKEMTSCMDHYKSSLYY